MEKMVKTEKGRRRQVWWAEGARGQGYSEQATGAKMGSSSNAWGLWLADGAVQFEQIEKYMDTRQAGALQRRCVHGWAAGRGMRKMAGAQEGRVMDRGVVQQQAGAGRHGLSAG